jgi:hypothetical protein
MGRIIKDTTIQRELSYDRLSPVIAVVFTFDTHRMWRER